MNHELEDALEKQDWAKITKRLTAYAKRRLGRNGRIEDAYDIAAEAIRQVLDPEYRNWNPGNEDLLWHLQSTVNGILHNRWRTKSQTQEHLHDFGREHGDERFHADSDPIRRINAAQVLDKAFDHASAAGDDLAQRILLEAHDNVVEPKELAAKLKEPISRIYEARRRLKSYLDAVLQEQEA